jgi:RNA-binding protein
MPLRDARFQGPRHAVWLVHAHAGRTDGPAIDTEDVMALTKKQTKQLRAMANQLNPLLWIGKNDVTDAAIKQADETIDKHELIKCAVQDGSGLTAREAADQLARRLGADVVQVIGNRFVLYRESRRDDVKKIVLVRE